MLQDQEKTKKQLIDELEEMRQRTTEMEAARRERNQTEEKLLREAEQKWLSLTENTSDFIMIVDNEGRIQYINRAIPPDTVDQVVGKTLFDYATPEHHETIRQAVAKVFQTGEQVSYESSVRHETGTLWFSTTMIPVTEEGKVLSAMAFNSNITEQKRAEEELRQSEGKYRTIFESTNDIMLLMDRKGKILDVNQRAKEIGLYEREELVGKNIRVMTNVVPKKMLVVVLKNFMKRMAGLNVPPYEVDMCKKNGEMLTFEVNARALRKDGKIVGDLAILRDVTERKRAEERYRALFEQAADSIVLIDPETATLVDFNDRACQSLGYTRPEFARLKIADIEAIESAEEIAKCTEETLKNGFNSFETRHRTKSGEIQDIQVSSRVISIGGKRFAQSIWHDITERKQAHEALQESERRYRYIFEGVPDAVLIYNRQGKLLDCNQAMLQRLGYSRQEFLHLAPADIVPPDLHQKLRDAQKRIWAGKAIITESEHRHKDGNVTPVEINSRRIEYQGEPAVLTVARDITERKQMEAALRKAEQEKGLILNSISESIHYIDREMRVLWANNVAAGTLGLTPEQMVGHLCYELLERSQPCVNCPVARAFNTGLPEQEQVASTHGGVLSMQAYPVRDDNGAIVGAVKVIQNVTERQRAYEALRKSEEKHRSLVHNVQLGIFRSTADPSGRFLEANPAMEEITGYSREELLEMDIADLYRHPEEREGMLEEIVAGGGNITKELHLRKKDGTELTVMDRKFPVRDAYGKILYFDGIMDDISERKRMTREKKELEQRAQVASRLASIGEMASGIAHEINNPLTGVVGFAQLLMRKDIPEDIKMPIETIYNGAQRVASIVHRLLTFARQHKPERSRTSINEVIENTLNLRAYSLETGSIKVTTRLAPELPKTMADAGQLQEVFLNIILNAEAEMKASHGRGNLVIKTERAGNNIRISFRDDGPGIAPENLVRIFDPFFTTREVGQGTGLGLSICHGIVTEHGGRLYAKSKPGKGATFIAELPILDGEPQSELDNPPADELKWATSARILVVDDEPDVTQFLREVLRGAGHQVETTGSAEDARERVSRGSYSLILLDIKLPGMSGIEFYQHLQQTASPLAKKVVFITGDVMSPDTRDFLDKTQSRYITKPFTTERLKAEIDLMLSNGF